MILNGKIPKDASAFWVRLQGVAIMGVAIFFLDKSQGRSFNSSSSVFYNEKSLLWKFGWGKGSEIKCSLSLAEATWYCGAGRRLVCGEGAQEELCASGHRFYTGKVGWRVPAAIICSPDYKGSWLGSLRWGTGTSRFWPQLSYLKETTERH